MALDGLLNEIHSINGMYSGPGPINKGNKIIANLTNLLGIESGKFSLKSFIQIINYIYIYVTLVKKHFRVCTAQNISYFKDKLTSTKKLKIGY